MQKGDGNPHFQEKLENFLADFKMIRKKKQQLMAFLLALIMIVGTVFSGVSSRAEQASGAQNYRNPSETVVQGEGLEISQKITSQLGDKDYLVEATVNTPDVSKIKKLEGDILLIMDVSGSMSGDRMTMMKQGVQEFVDLLYQNAGDVADQNLRFAGVTFNGGVDSVQDWETDPNAFKSYISGIESSGGTDVTAGINEGKKFMATSTAAKKAIIVFGDGDINYTGDLAAEHPDASVYLLSIQVDTDDSTAQKIVGSKLENHKKIQQVNEIAQELTGIGQEMIEEIGANATISMTLNDGISFVESQVEGLPAEAQAEVSGNTIKITYDPSALNNLSFTYKVRLDGISNDFIPINKEAKVSVGQSGSETDLSFPIPEIRYPSAPSITLSKKADKTVVWEEGQVINYTVTIENNGENLLENLKLYDKLELLFGQEQAEDQKAPEQAEEEVDKVEAPEVEKEALPEEQKDAPEKDQGADRGELTTPEQPLEENVDAAKNPADQAGDVDPNAPVDPNTPADADPNAPQDPTESEVVGPEVPEAPEAPEADQAQDQELVGETTESPVAFTELDKGFKTIDLEKTELAPGEKLEVNYSYTITAEDLKAGKIHNVAVVRGESSVSDELVEAKDQAEVLVKTGSILLEQAASIESGKLDEKFDFIYKITNTGEEPLDSLTLEELVDYLAEEAKALAPSHQEKGQKAEAQEENQPKTQADQEKPAPSKEEKPAEGEEEVITVEVDSAKAPAPQEEEAESKETKPAASQGQAIALGQDTLAPGESIEIRLPHTINQEDVKRGEVVSKGIAKAKVQGTEMVVQSQDEAKVLVTRETPGINLTKKVDKVRVSKPGDFVVYRLEVINIGSERLEKVELKDPMLEDQDLKLDKTSLDPMEKTFVEVEYKITEADFKKGELVNTASVEAVSTSGVKVDDEDSATVVMEKKCTIIQLDKTADRSSVGKLGQKVEYRFVITNNGSETLHDIELNDPMLGGKIKLDKTSLEPKESMTVKQVYETTKGDMAKTSFTNKATVKGVGSLTNRVVEDKDCFEVKVVKMPQTGVGLGAGAGLMTLSSLIGLATLALKKRKSL